MTLSFVCRGIIFDILLWGIWCSLSTDSVVWVLKYPFPLLRKMQGSTFFSYSLKIHSLSVDESQPLFSCPWGNTAQPTDRCYQSILTSGQNGCGQNVLLHKSGLDLRRLSAFFLYYSDYFTLLWTWCSQCSWCWQLLSDLTLLTTRPCIKYIQFNKFMCIHINQLHKLTTLTVLGMTLNQVISCHVLLNDVL